jgi:hypothetical protein
MGTHAVSKLKRQQQLLLRRSLDDAFMEGAEILHIPPPTARSEPLRTSVTLRRRTRRVKAAATSTALSAVSFKPSARIRDRVGRPQSVELERSGGPIAKPERILTITRRALTGPRLARGTVV